MGLFERMSEIFKRKSENEGSGKLNLTLEDIERIESDARKEAERIAKENDQKRVEEYKKEHGISDPKITAEMMREIRNFPENERAGEFEKLQLRLQEEREQRDSFILDTINFYEWLKNPEIKKVKGENYSEIEKAKSRSGEEFFFDKFCKVGLENGNAKIDGFVCDHDGVRPQDRMFCVPMDADAFCECVKISNAKVLRQIATDMPYSIKEYVYRFGWGEKEIEQIKSSIIERYAELNTMTVGRLATSGDESQMSGNAEER